MTAIIKKEIKSYFTSIIGYIFVGFFLIMTAYFFGVQNIDSLSPYYGDTLYSQTNLFMILIPVLTMRLFSEEQKQRTDQLLYTSPLTVWRITLGKYIAALAIYTAALVITLIFPLMMAEHVKYPWAQTLCSYLGFFLLGACFIAIGIFVSSLTDNQIVAAVATFAAILTFVVINSFAASAPKDRFSSGVFLVVIVAILAFVIYNATKNLLAGAITGALGIIAMIVSYLANKSLYDSVIYNVLNWFSLLSRFNNFRYGILNASDIVYSVTFAAAFVFLTINAIENRRWR